MDIRLKLVQITQGFTSKAGRGKAFQRISTEMDPDFIQKFKNARNRCACDWNKWKNNFQLNCGIFKKAGLKDNNRRGDNLNVEL